MVRKPTVGDVLIRSLGDALAFERGELPARVSAGELTARDALVDAPPRYTAARIRATRLKLGYSQTVFARALNVSAQTVRAWEQGSRLPAGPTLRLLEIAEDAPEVLQRKVHPRPAPLD